MVFLLEVQILHISDVEVRETKLIGDSPIIIVMVGIFYVFLNDKCCKQADSLIVTTVPRTLLQFRTQQVYCVRDKNGAITEGSQVELNIHTYCALSLL